MMTLDPNRYAGPTEARLLREDIAADKAAQSVLKQRAARAQSALHDAKDVLRAAQEAVDSAQSIFDEITEQDRALESRMRRSHGMLHPIRRLPPELLSMAFEQVLEVSMEDDPQVPFRLAATCRRWRDVALSSPAVWRNVVIKLDDAAGADVEWRRTCYIQVYLARSSTIPLRVEITHHSYATFNRLFWSAIAALFERSCRFSFTTSQTVVPELDECFKQPAPHLVNFNLDYDGPDIEIAQLSLFTSAPRLKSFHYTGPAISRHSYTGFPLVEDVSFFTENCDIPRLLALFQQFPNVRRLRLLDDELTAPGPFTILCDSLEEFTLVTFGFDMHVARCFRFPSLRTAEISAFADDALLSADSLVAFMHSALPSVETLTLHFTADLDMLAGLKACQRLRHLTLRGYGASAEAFFAAMSVQDAHGSWISPRLQSFAVRAKITRETISAAIEGFASARGRSAPKASRPPTALRRMEVDRDYVRPASASGQNLQDRVNDILNAS